MEYNFMKKFVLSFKVKREIVLDELLVPLIFDCRTNRSLRPIINWNTILNK